MRISSRDGHYVICPFCEGKGKMRRSELAARLANHDFESQLTACRQELVKPEANREGVASEPAKDFKREVLSGRATRILWRRSPKE